MNGVIWLILISLLSGLTLVQLGSGAEKFPSREIVIVNYQAAGGSLDMECRVLAEYLKKELGVPVVVENHTEGGGIKGIMDVYRARPDGYTLLPNLMPRNAQVEIAFSAPFKILELSYLIAFRSQEGIVFVSRESPYKTLKELQEASKKKSLNCSISGMGTVSHLNAMLVKKKAGVNLEVVPFKGSAPAMVALLGRNVDLSVLDSLTVLQQKDKIRPLAVFSDRRAKHFPDVPTIKELGYDVAIGSSVLGISGPPGLPEGVCRTLTDALVKVVRDPKFVSKIEGMGATPIHMTGAEFRALAESSYKFVMEYKELFIEKK